MKIELIKLFDVSGVRPVRRMVGIAPKEQQDSSVGKAATWCPQCCGQK